MAISPMMKQYLEIKDNHKDQILFFRLGDFYEMFFEDALTVSRELELTLTGKECGLEERAPMCGVPYHSAETYIRRLIEKGYRVAIAEQMEEAGKGVKLVNREVVRVITPGTVIEESMLSEGENNYISCAFYENYHLGIAFCDVSTGEFLATERVVENGEDIRDELSRFSPNEILLNEGAFSAPTIKEYILSRMPIATEVRSEEDFEEAFAKSVLSAHFSKDVLEKSGLNAAKYAMRASGALMDYIQNTQKAGVDRIQSVRLYSNTAYMTLDESVRRNLELLKNMNTSEVKGSLLWVLDRTSTAMGKRLLKNVLIQPLLQPEAILQRQDAVGELVDAPILLGDLRETLRSVYDLQRLMTRVVYGTVTPRELRSLAYTCEKLPDVKNLIENTKSFELQMIWSDLDPLTDIQNQIDTILVDEPPITLKEGGVIRRGYESELDELHELVNNTKGVLASIEQQERERTGIKNLKIGYNKVFGYYIEVTNSYLSQVPEEYIRKQTLTGGERYITEELKELEAKILGASEKIVKIETALFEQIRDVVTGALPRIQKTAELIAWLDIYASFAYVSARNQYVRPTVDHSGIIDIKEGRHPVVEQMLPDEPFVSNDCYLDEGENQVILLTGPNMAGKSTYMRQVAIITLMAQIGCFVPATEARIGVVDSIFTRIGASDDLSTGRSTFMVEMSEVAHILSHATEKSLIILDEIGRGTSTYDGMSIARAVVEHIADKEKVGAKTLFATHYHELTELGDTLFGVKNYSIAVKKRGDDIVFIRRIVRGAADESYGIEVSKLAGIPEEVVERAKEVLQSLEEGESLSDDQMVEKRRKREEAPDIDDSEKAVLHRLKDTDVEVLSPIEALNFLYELKKEL